MEKKIEDLCVISSVDGVTDVDFTFHPTMIDGKVCNAVTGTKSTTSCYICGAKYSDLRNKITRPTTELILRYGIGNLHIWINFGNSV